MQDFGLFLQGDQGPGVVPHDVRQWNVAHRRKQVAHVKQLAPLVGNQRKHLGFGVAVDYHGLEAEGGVHGADAFGGVQKPKLAAFLQGKDIFFEEAGFFPGVGFGGPLPVAPVGPEGGLREGRNQHSVGTTFYCAADVVEVQVGEENVGDVGPVVARRRQASVQGVFPVEVVVGKELVVLFLADSRVDEGESVSVFHQQQPHGPGAQVVLVCGVGALPEGLGHNAKHGAAVELEKSGGKGGQFHRLARKNSVRRSPQSSASTPPRTSVLGWNFPPCV